MPCDLATLKKSCRPRRDTVGDAVGFAPNCGSVNPKTTKRAFRLESGFRVITYLNRMSAVGCTRDSVAACSAVCFMKLTVSRREVHEDGLMMIDSGLSVNVCPKFFGESVLEKSDGSVKLRGADGRTFQAYGKRQIWLLEIV